MRKSGIIVLVIIGGIIAAYAGLQVSPADTAPPLIDSPQIVEEVEINPIKETSTPDNVEFYIDEDGIKHYVISARDNPTLGD